MRRRALLLAFVVPFAVAIACREPTQIEIEVVTDLACPGSAALALEQTSIFAARPNEIEARVSSGASSTSTRECTPGALARVGSLVFVPSGAQDEPIALRVYGDVSGACGARCIEAKRSLRYQPHRAQKMQIVLRSTCMGVRCDPGLTCVRGSCVDEVCPAGACDEEDLVAERDGGVADAATPDAAPRDATLDGPSVLDAPLLDAPVSLDSGVCFTTLLPPNPTQVYHFESAGAFFVEDLTMTQYPRPMGSSYGPGQCKEGLYFQGTPTAAVAAPLTTTTDLDVYLAVRTLETDVRVVTQPGSGMMEGWAIAVVAGQATFAVSHATGTKSVSVAVPISDGQWHVVVARWSAAQMSLRVDAAFNADLQPPSGPLNFTSAVRFGEAIKGYALDEAHFYAK